jgi:hypothetical protein
MYTADTQHYKSVCFISFYFNENNKEVSFLATLTFAAVTYITVHMNACRCFHLELHTVK